MINIILIYLAAVNLAAFIVYGWDKRLAVRERYRISEKTLILLALFGGSIGSLAAMHLFHHKTRKKKFAWGVPAILALQAALCIYLIIRASGL